VVARVKAKAKDFFSTDTSSNYPWKIIAANVPTQSEPVIG